MATAVDVLHVLRILQEALAHVLEPAGAKRIRVATALRPDGVAIEVSDDGRGFSGEGRPGGHGLANMRRRARAVGGELCIEPSASGTTLSLILPAGRP